MSQRDSLGDRQKEYEAITSYRLSKKSNVIARIDGKAFHTYTKGLQRPFDHDLVADMDSTAIHLCQTVQNTKFAFVQSDEISLFIQEDGIDSMPWFDNKVQKMASVAASIATAEFNNLRICRRFAQSISNRREMEESNIIPRPWDMEYAIALIKSAKTAEFDARFWTVPSAVEVHNYFLWRQQDATKNSISAAAQSVYSQKELLGKNGLEQQEMLFQKGINWNSYPSGVRRGRFIERRTYVNNRLAEVTKSPGEPTRFRYIDGYLGADAELTELHLVRNRWEAVECPIFSQDVDFLLKRIKNGKAAVLA